MLFRLNNCNMNTKLVENYLRKELTVAQYQSEKMFIEWYHKKSIQGLAIFFIHDSERKSIFINFSDVMKL